MVAQDFPIKLMFVMGSPNTSPVRSLNDAVVLAIATHLL